MARAIWSGVVTFGMVSIPVGLYSAVEEKDVRFHQIHKQCGSRIKQQKWCPVDECVVPPEEIEKGFEISKGRYVIVTPEELEKLPIPSKHTIAVNAFVKVDEIDPLYFDSAYYLLPEEAGRKPFQLLMRALEDKGVAAVAKIAIRSKESLCVLRPARGTLVLETLHYPDEIREVGSVEADKASLDPKELKMAESLVDLLSEPFEPGKYHDEYRQALMTLIQEKSAGHQILEQPTPEPTKVIDLMDALKKSLEAAKAERKKTG